MTLKGDTKFKGKLTCGLKNDIKNFVNFHMSSEKSEKLHFDGLLLSKAYTHPATRHRGNVVTAVPRRLSSTYPYRPISTSLRRLL